MQYLVTNLQQNQLLAQMFSMKNMINTVFLLYGDIGAGKSTFVKNFLYFRDIEYIGSPTFSLVHKYEKANVVHCDLYRVNESPYISIFPILEPYICENSTFFIEWPIDGIALSNFQCIEVRFANGG